MSSPNPLASLPRSPLSQTPSSNETSSSPMSAPVMPQFREVPAFPYLILQKRGQRFQVKNSSLLHARLTGNLGSPTPGDSHSMFESIEEYVRWNAAAKRVADGGDDLRLRRSTRSRRPTHKLRSHLTHSPGDQPQPQRFASAVRHAPQADPLHPVETFEKQESPTQDPFTSPIQASADTPEVHEDRDTIDAEASLQVGVERDQPHRDSIEERRQHNEPRAADPEVQIPYHVHRRSPYATRLRSRTRQLVAQIREDASVTGLPLDAAFVKEARIKKYNPSLPARPNARLLLHACSFGLRGITVAEFGKIMRCCMSCDRYIFLESTTLHACNPSGPPPDVTRADFALTGQLLLKDKFPGLSLADLEKLFHVCDTCHRIHSARNSRIHDCPGVEHKD